MQALLERVLDGDRFSYWASSTPSDATTVTIEMSFQARTNQMYRQFDLVILQNINWKNFLGEYFDQTSGTYVTIPGMDYQVATADNAETDLIVQMPTKKNGNSVRFTIYRTIIANSLKQAGNIIVCDSVVQPTYGMKGYKPGFSGRMNELKLGDGTVSREYVLRSATSYELWRAGFEIQVASQAELNSLRTIKREGKPFIFIPEPGNRKDEVFQVHFDGEWGHAYELAFNRDGGYAIPMKVKEVGRH
jgi:hypothetical protein